MYTHLACHLLRHRDHSPEEQYKQTRNFATHHDDRFNSGVPELDAEELMVPDCASACVSKIKMSIQFNLQRSDVFHATIYYFLTKFMVWLLKMTVWICASCCEEDIQYMTQGSKPDINVAQAQSCCVRHE
jgi:hypothetical protein